YYFVIFCRLLYVIKIQRSRFQLKLGTWSSRSCYKNCIRIHSSTTVIHKTLLDKMWNL
ncbi:hypothetical protein L9F63_017385, partial [Diploptera punctata]